MSVLVAYASKHGATEGIAERIWQTLRLHGIAAEVREAESVGDVSGYDAVVLGSAVYFGSWMREATELARRNRETLARVPVWLFSSGPVGDATLPEPKEIAELRAAIAPRDHREFAGALWGSELGLTERVMAKVIKAPTGDFRDWGDVTAWAASIARALEASASVSSQIK